MLLLLALMLQTAPSGNVQKILVSPIPVHSADGAETARVDRKQIKLPAQIVAAGKFGQLGIEHGGATVYVRRADVQYDLASDCVRSSARPDDRSVGAAMAPGLKAGAGAGQTPCIKR